MIQTAPVTDTVPVIDTEPEIVPLSGVEVVPVPVQSGGGRADATTAPGTVGEAGAVPVAARIPEIGGRKDGPEPTRYGDWEKNGRCVDF